MPSSIAHASVAILFSPILATQPISRRLVATVALAAAVPDVDAIGRPFGLGDVALLGGHRAITHSVFFAIVAAAAVVALESRRHTSASRWIVGLYAFAVVLSHGALDAFTTYGEGVAFFAPASMERFTAPWHPLSGVLTEAVLIWLPAWLVYRFWLRARLPAVS